MKVNFKSVLLLVLIIFAVITTVSMYNEATMDKTDFTYGDLLQLLDEGAVKKCVIDGDSVVTIEAYEVKIDEDGKLIKDENGFVYNYDAQGNRTIREYTYALSYTSQIEAIHELATKDGSGLFINIVKGRIYIVVGNSFLA